MSLKILLRIRGFVSLLRYGFENSDPYQNVTDPELRYTMLCYRCNSNGNFCVHVHCECGTNYTMEQQLEECWVSLIGSPVPFADFPLAEPPLVFPLVKPPLVFPLVELPPVLGLLWSMPKRSHWGLNTVREKNTRNFRLFLPERQITGRKIILMESNVKCRYLKNCPVNPFISITPSKPLMSSASHLCHQGLGWPCIIVRSFIYQQLIMTLHLQI